MAIDPVASALDAIVAYLATALDSVVTVLRGWPEHGTDFDLSSLPVVSLVAGEASEERVSPFSVGTEEDDDGNLVVTYKVAGLVFVAQLDLWAAYRVQLDEAVAAVDAELTNRLPASSGLWLDQADYYDRPIAISVTGFRREDGAESAAVGEWRATWMLQVATDKVAQTTHPKISEITIDVTAQIAEDDDGAVTDSTTIS